LVNACSCEALPVIPRIGRMGDGQDGRIAKQSAFWS
jgi:hypothetical protein